MPDKTPQTLLLDIWTQNAEQQRELGTVVAQLGILLDDRALASEQRKQIFDAMSTLQGKLEKLEQRLSPIEQTLGRITPLVDDHETRHQRVLGGAAVGLRAVHFIGAALVAVGGGVFSLILWVLNRHPPGF